MFGYLIIMSVRQSRTNAMGPSSMGLTQEELDAEEKEQYIKLSAQRAVADINGLYSKWYQLECKRIGNVQQEETRSQPVIGEKEREYALKRMSHIQASLLAVNSKLRFTNMPQELASKVAKPIEVLRNQLELSSNRKDWIWHLEQNSTLDVQFAEMLNTVNELEKRVDSILNQPAKGCCGTSAYYKTAYAALASACDRFMYSAELFASLFTLAPLAPAEVIITKKEKQIVPMNLENSKEQLVVYLEELMKSIPDVVKTIEVPVMTIAEGPKKAVVTSQEVKPKLDAFIMGLNYFHGYGYPQNKQKSVSLLEVSAEKDHCSEAAAFLGKIYLEGDGVIQSDSEALKWFSLAGKMGNTTGLYWEGFMYENSRGLSSQSALNKESQAENKMKADQLYRDAASGLNGKSQANPEALFALARIRDVARPTYDSEVFQLLERAHELGNLDAANMLGEMYAEGRVVGVSAEMSQRKAVELITEAAKKGHIGAQSNLGKLLVQGYGGNKSHSDAKIWLEKAVKKFDPEAMFLLGFITYMEALSTKNEVELHKANMLFRHVLSINKNHDDALYYLADMLENGRGGAKDLVLAAENYKTCIDHNPNHHKALYKLGRIYLEGKGVIRSDKHLALEYMQASAKLGNANAMVYLGDLFQEEGVVGKDLARSMQFYTDAVRQGNGEAKLKQAELLRKAPYMFSNMADSETLRRQAAARGYIEANA